MKQIYIEIDPGSGFAFAGIGYCDDSEQVNELARELVNDNSDYNLPPPPSKETLAVAESNLCGFLDEGALLSLNCGSLTEEIQATAKRAKDLRWSGIRIRALVA